MIRRLPRNIMRFVLLILIQILIVNNIEFSGYIIPYIYILFILLLPFETPKWVILITGFLLGFTMDIFMNTYGIHTTSTVFIAFIRPSILKILAPRDGYETGTYPRIFYYGFWWFIRYSAVIIIIHHSLLFYLELFSVTNIFPNLIRVILSSVFSLTLVVLSQFFVFRK